ncbi:hypothetical protein FK091_23775 [Salmonella enterica]|nr:hypothetical protein [Salmonella enterica]EDY6032447.1 hypothetical protein [Salmonella enterica]MEA22802.1 hypothetical protein [Salmonella enterica]MLG27058.1 hypothetical protein [Salmonella enterica]
MFKSISGKIKSEKPSKSRNFFDGEPEEPHTIDDLAAGLQTKSRGFLDKLLRCDPELTEEAQRLVAFVCQLEDPSLGEYQRNRIITVIRLRCRKDPALAEIFSGIAAMDGVGAHSPFANMPMPAPFNK